MIPILRASDAGELKRRVMNRSQLQNEEVSRIVKEIVARVRQEGDAALFDYTAKFDHVTMTAETVLVTKDEIARAYAAASPRMARCHARSRPPHHCLPREAEAEHMVKF